MIVSLLLFILVLSCTEIFSLDNNEYCKLSCDLVVKQAKNTVCERDEQKCGAGPRCGPDFRPIRLTDSHRQYVLDLHNYFRNRVAMGQESRNHQGQPPAADMKLLTYNKELEFIAQCWANTCNGNPLLHDNCRRTAKYSHVGQNLGFINSSTSTINTYKSLKELILLWYNEVDLFQSDWVNDTKDRGPNAKVGHYTQMLWADTDEIGCGASYYTTKTGAQTWNHFVLVCNYGPGGNYLGLPVYEVGIPASKCPAGLKPNKHYKGLCGNYKRVTASKKKYDIFV